MTKAGIVQKNALNKRGDTEEPSDNHFCKGVQGIVTDRVKMLFYGSIPDQDRAVQIKQHLYTVCPFHQEQLCVAIPTYDRTQRGFQASNYWRGPIWVNINWMIYKGLLDYGFKELAGKIRLNIFRLVEQLGFWEYFYPLDKRGLGSDRFSWTAALLIDLLCEKADHDPVSQASAKK